MYRFLFNIFTNPLGLPIPALYEYIIIFIISLVAFKIAWEVSPGGEFGSLIHWIVRLIITLVIWSITYLFIWLVKCIISNWIIFLVLFAIIGALLVTRILIIKNKKA